MPSMATDLAPYLTLTDAACDARISATRRKLGDRLTILAHHYQRDEVVRHADHTGDALKLTGLAASSKAEFIVLCGVRFMAEVAAILSHPEQTVVLPNTAAGCALVDMAGLANVEGAWRELGQVLDADTRVTPVSDIHSAAELKAFCGGHGGIVCTPSNARQVLAWALSQGEKVLFFPDRHLGRHTGYQMDIPLDDTVVWDFDQPMGGLTEAQIRKARIILWKGFCPVHRMFEPAYIDRFKEKYPDVSIIAHPQAGFDVCRKSDYVGSSEYIVKTVRAAGPGSRWLVGTELNLVNRLREEGRTEGKSVHFMSPAVGMCSTMFRIDPQHLLWTLQNLLSGKPVNQVALPEKDARLGKVALERMLEVSVLPL